MSEADDLFDQLARRLRVISVHFAEAADELVALRKALAQAAPSTPGQQQPGPPQQQPWPGQQLPQQQPGPQHGGYPNAPHQWQPPPPQQWPGQQPQQWPGQQSH